MLSVSRSGPSVGLRRAFQGQGVLTASNEIRAGLGATQHGFDGV
jgi:hypothetical protein